MSQSATLTVMLGASNADIEEYRDRFLTHLSQTLARLEAVRTDLASLRSEHAGDADFIEGCAGSDIAAFLDSAARSIRASYAVAVAVIEGQLPADRCTPPKIRVIDRSSL